MPTSPIRLHSPSARRFAGVLAAAGLMVMAMIGVARAGHDTDNIWALDGTGAPQKAGVVNGDTSGGLPASFEYNVPDNKNFRSVPINETCGIIDVDGDGISDQDWTGSWQFKTTGEPDGAAWRHLAWTWQGSHAFTNVFLETYVYVNGSTVQLLNVDNTNLPSGAFDFSGSTTVTVGAGESYGFILCMSNGDTGAALEGSFTVESLPTFDASLSASPALIFPGEPVTMTLALDPDGHTHTIDKITVQLPTGAAYADDTATVDGDELEPEVSGNLLTWNGPFPVTDPTDLIVAFDIATTDTIADPATFTATATRSYTATALPAGPFTATATLDLGVEPAGATQLFRAVPLMATGDPTYYPERLAILGFIQAAPDASGTFTLRHSDTCADGDLGLVSAEFPIAFADSSITTNPDGQSFFGLTIPTTVDAGYVTGSFGAGTESDCIVVGPDNDSWTRALRIPLPGGTGASDGVIDAYGTSRWYKFSVQPGATATVSLTNLPEDYDLAVFTDIAQAYTELTDPSLQDLNRLGAEFAPSIYSPSIYSPSIYSPSIYSGGDYAPSIYSPSIYSPSIYSPSIYSPSIYSPSIYSPDAFAIAQIRSIIGVSTSFGTTDEVVVANTWNNTGDFYIRVTGKNGAFDAGSAFDVGVTLTGLTCPDLASLQHPADRAAAAGAGTYETVILWDSSHISAADAAEITALDARLTDLAGATKGVVIDLASNTEVQALRTQALTNFGCIYATNLWADSIKNIVDSYRGGGGALQYVALIGGDDSIPFYRYPDQAILGPEQDYDPPVADSTISQASLRLNYILGQDEYGSQSSVYLDGTSMPIPQLAVGRVVETASEAIGMIDAYLGVDAPANYANGVLTPASSLTTAYDFLTDTGLAVSANLSSGMADNRVKGDELIDYSDPSPGPASWTADDFRTSLLESGRHDLVFLAGHFSANSALAADYATQMITIELALSPVDLANAIVFSAGCHSGYNIIDGEIVPGVTLPLDWAQAFSQKRATLIAGTGYQYGDTDFIEYSERLYVGFSAQLSTGTGPVSVGEALVRAKQDYMATTPDLRGLHRKSVIISTVFGLPMTSVYMPGDPVAGVTIPNADVSPIDVAADPSRPGTNGLSYADLTLASSGSADIPYSLSKAPLVELESVEGGTVFATYLEGPNGIVSNPAEPIVPLVSADVGLSDRVMRGILFLGGSYADTALAPNVPLTGAPTTELSSVHPAFVSPNYFPLRIATANYFGELTGQGRTILNVTPVQHQAFAADQAVRRVFDGVDLRLYYSSNTDPVEFANPDGTTTTVYPALAAPPNITNVMAYPDGTDTVFRVNVTGDPEVGIQQVWITYDDTAAFEWVSMPLTQNALDSTLWEGRSDIGSPDDLNFIVQAVNGVGLVSVDDNFGNTFSSAPLTAPVDSSAAILSVTGTGTFGSDIVVKTQLTEGNGITPIGGETIVVSLGNAVRFATTDESGVAEIVLPLDSAPGEYLLTTTFYGGGGYDPAVTSQTFTITQAQPVIDLATGAGLATATLVDQQGDAIKERTLYFHVLGASTDITVAVITDFQGVARLPNLGLVGGTYDISAYFLGRPNVPLPINDPNYLPASDGPAAMVVATDLGTVEAAPATAEVDETVEITATFGPAATGSHTATIEWGDGTTTDAVIAESEGVWSLSGSHSYGDEELGTQTVAVTLLDATRAVAATGSVDVEVVDTTAPEFDAGSVPGDQTVEATGPLGAPASWTDPTATDSVDPTVVVECDSLSGSTFALGATTVTCTATDASGNFVKASFTITVEDTTAPTVTPPADITGFEGDTLGGATVPFTATATDIVDGSIAPTCAPVSGSTFALGATTVTCTATDAAGNSAEASFTITVVDTTAPEFDAGSVPGDQTVEATGPLGATASWTDPTATDIVDGSIAPTCAPVSGSTFALGATTVTCTATDAAGNSAEASFTITVEDTTAPEFDAGSVPGDQMVEGDIFGGATASWTDPTATDIVDGSIAPTCAPVSGSTFALGATTVTCTATDAAGNSAEASFTITVEDTTAPIVTVPADITVQADSLEGAVVTFTATAIDIVDGAIEPTCDDPDDPAVFPVGTTTVTCAATDASGNIGTASFDITVEDPAAVTVTEQLIIWLQAISGDPQYDRTVTRDVDAAIRQLEKVIDSAYWDPTFTTLDTVDGDRVFDRFADTVAELKKLVPADLSAEDAELIFGPDGIIQILARLAEGLVTETVIEFDPGYDVETHELSCNVAAGPPCSSIQQDIDKAYLDWDAGVEENAIRDFRNGWRTATDALAV